MSLTFNECTDKIFGKVYFKHFLIWRLFQTKPGTIKCNLFSASNCGNLDEIIVKQEMNEESGK